MPRPPRLDYAGACHLVTVRMTGPAFGHESANLGLLETLAAFLPKYAMRCHGYVLLEATGRLLLESKDGRLPQAMAAVTRSLSRRLGKTLGGEYRPDGRYRSMLFEKSHSLLALNRHLMFAPVRSGVVRWCDEYLWSSFRATAGLEPCPPFLYLHDLLKRFGKPRSEARERYADYVEEAAVAPPPIAFGRTPKVIGSPDFVRRHLAMLAGRIPAPAAPEKAPREEGKQPRMPLNRIFRGPGEPGPKRDRAIARACLAHGHSRTAVARYLGLHPSTVGRILKRMGDGGV